MRWLVFATALTSACAQDSGHLGNPLMLPVSGATTLFDNAAYAQRRGTVEVIVKSNFDAIIFDIASGGGPVLTDAMDAAGIPPRDRPARVIQLRSNLGLYQANPDALVTTLMVYGG
ncbi:hypothetical protein AN191_05280 [Loktanella sp. 5RATIMAR09]|uniref:hypothetical protein n=1 Tax=Loktanella sp. 5RATIMAR09 TaxID=1225655 RepID=UPI0006EB5ADC|nr:hypothetical protein [Loktanella sp. 5RATIMAR09]KQI72447.1 hypothetical protein AN191_05280 [Loktanella sp. 5RATIMAR09]